MRRRQQGSEKQEKISGIGPFPPELALLTAAETCNVLKISRRTLWSWSNGRCPILPPIKIGGLPRWTVADVQRLIHERKIAA
jgi:predicted DNA-binding transcriptional regulator AlpA